MSEPQLRLVRKQQAVDAGQVPTKIFIKYRPGRSVPAAIRVMAEALVEELKQDKTWFDKCLIHADGVTKIWVVKEAGGVQRMVQAEVHALRDYDARAIVQKLRAELVNLTTGGTGG